MSSLTASSIRLVATGWRSAPRLTLRGLATATSTPTPGRRFVAPEAKQEGSIEQVFATLSGGSLDQHLPDRFRDVKQSIVQSSQQAQAMTTAWRQVLQSLESETETIRREGAALIPQVQYPGDVDASSHDWIGSDVVRAIRQRGTVVIRGVVPEEVALQWKQDIRGYVAANPTTKGYPADDPQVFELYWSKAQLAARGHPSLLRASRAMLNFFHAPAQQGQGEHEVASLRNPVFYCDRLRIRTPGDATFALGPHIDGGGVERWEDAAFRDVWHAILQPNQQGQIDWQQHDPWCLGPRAQRLEAQTSMYDGAGSCSVFRPLQGWLSLSSTGANEGTLRVLPMLQSASAYIVLRPFFRPHRSRLACSSSEAYLAADNWHFSVDDCHFDGCSALGRNIELNDDTHPHLRLNDTMTSIPRVEPGDFVLWHCDQVHAVEAKHQGAPGHDSSVLYIPAIPLTRQNFHYLTYQRQAFEKGVPPPDFPGGQGESQHVGRGQPQDLQSFEARRAMGLAPFAIENDMPLAEQRLLEECNAQLAKL